MEIGSFIGVAFALWVAQGWYLNTRLLAVHRKLDALAQQFDGLREYLYEIDPQFDDERSLTAAMYESLDGHAFDMTAFDHMRFIEEKKRSGRRTLNTPLVNE